jgi:hypothetical protein
MRNFLLFLGLLALAWVGFRWLAVEYGGKIAVPANSPVSNVGERYGVVGPDFGKETAKTAPAAAPSPSSPSAPAGPLTENVFVCPRSVDAFDPAVPGRQIGFFNAGSRLQVGEFHAASGMFAVTYQDPSGRVIAALCRPGDLGRKAPENASTATGATSGFASPSSSAAPAQNQGTVSSWRNRVEKAAGGH